MQKVFEKIIEKLEENIVFTWKHDYEGGRKDAFKEAIEIVKQEAKDYNNIKTNADRIRAMSDEELAKWFATVTDDVLHGSMWNKKGWLDFLQSEVKEKLYVEELDER